MAKPKQGKRSWFQILATKHFNNQVLGESLVYEPESLMGKPIKQNLMNLTNDMKKQNINISFKVTDVKEKKGVTSIIGYDMLQSSAKRLVRRNIDKIDLSFIATTKDGVKIRIKPVIITRNLAKGSVLTRLRKTAIAQLKKQIESMLYDEIITKLIHHKLQLTMKDLLRKIYPLKLVEIRSLSVVTEEATKKVEVVEETKAPEQEA